MIATTLVEGVADWAVALMERLGGLGAGVIIALENLFPPLPSEVILPLAGFAASRGELSLIGAIAWTTAGSVVGAMVLYTLGAWLGPHRLRAVVARVPLLDVADVDRGEAWFARYGRRAVFFGRMVPLVRSVISVPAGVERMPVATFVVLTLLGSLLWNAVFVLAGYQLGEQWFRVEAYAGAFSRVVVVSLAIALVVVLVRRLRRRAGDPDG